eukprot:TRINITY_DN1895_c0_g1_i5.p1 TRINITY_DN1895_c0_g1~~TRINITY_DN1895_c0_g1_i5.p1  ORF type:complete len:1375 (-),score=598.38 TRINITY_DN1895_c0_g1_i5:150-4274(-)
MCIRDRYQRRVRGFAHTTMAALAWLCLTLVALVAGHNSPEGAHAGEANLWEGDGGDAGFELGAGDGVRAGPDMDLVQGVVDDTKERILLKKEGENALKQANAEISSTLSQATEDLAAEPRSQAETQAIMNQKGARVARQAALSAHSTEPDLTASEGKDFTWGVDAASEYMKDEATAARMAKRDPYDDLSSLEKEVADDENQEQTADARAASKIADQIRQRQAEAKMQQQDDEKIKDMEKEAARQQVKERQAESSAEDALAKMTDKLDGITRQASHTESPNVRKAADDAEEALKMLRQQSEARTDDAQNVAKDARSKALEADARQQLEENKASEARLAMESQEMEAEMEAVGANSRASLETVAHLAGLAQNAVDTITPKVPSAAQARQQANSTGLEDVQRLQAAETKREVDSAIQEKWDKMEKEMAKYKKAFMQQTTPANQSPSPNSAPPERARSTTDPNMVGLQNKLARMEGQLKVVREEERSNRGSSAQTAELLAQERALVQQEMTTQKKIAAEPTTATASTAQQESPPQQQQQPPPARATTAATPADLEAQAALVKRVDALENALLAVKSLHESSNSHAAVDARNRAMEAHLQLLEREIEDVKAQKSAAAVQQAALSTDMPELARMRQELQKDARVEQTLTQGAAVAEKHEYSSMAIAKKKAVLLRIKTQLEAKLERLARAKEMNAQKVQSRMEGSKARRNLEFEKKVARATDLNSEAERAERLAIEQAEEALQRKQAMAKEKAEEDEQLLQQQQSEKRTDLIKAKMERESAKAMEVKRLQMLKAAEAKVMAKIAGLSKQRSSKKAQAAKLGEELANEKQAEAQAEAKEEAAAAKKAEALHAAKEAAAEQHDVAAKLQGEVFKDGELQATAETEKQQAEELKDEIGSAKKKLEVKKVLEGKLDTVKMSLQKATLDQQQKQAENEQEVAEEELQRKEKDAALANTKAVVDEVAKKLKREKHELKEQAQEASKEQEKATDDLRRNLDRAVTKRKEELKDQRASEEAVVQGLRARLRNAQADKRSEEMAISAALARQSKEDAEERDEELAAAQKRQADQEYANKEKAKEENGKAASIEEKAARLLKASQRTSSAAVAHARKEAHLKIHAAKLRTEDRAHRARQHYASQVALAQEQEHGKKEEAMRAKRAAVMAEKTAMAGAEKNTQKAMEAIAKRAADDERNAFIDAQKSKHSELAQAVALQRDAKQKLAAARKSLSKAQAEASGARKRAKLAQSSAKSQIKRNRKLVKEGTDQLNALTSQRRALASELAHERQSLEAEKTKRDSASTKSQELEARFNALDAKNKNLHKQLTAGSGVNSEHTHQLEQVRDAIEALRGKIMETKSTLRRVERRKARQVLDAAKACLLYTSPSPRDS